MEQPIVIDISPFGQVEGMHREEFPLGFLGPQRIVRASDIRFNELTQRWRIHLNLRPQDGPGNERFQWILESGEFETYESARTFEVNWLNNCRLKSFHPCSIDGANLAAQLLSNAIGGHAVDQHTAELAEA